MLFDFSGLVFVCKSFLLVCLAETALGVVSEILSAMFFLSERSGIPGVQRVDKVMRSCFDLTNPKSLFLITSLGT